VNRQSAIGLMYRFTVRAHHTSDSHRGSAKNLPQSCVEIPFNTGNAAEEVQAERPELGKSMASKVGLGQQTQPSNSTSLRKLMPLRRADRSKT